ncbi:MAG: hypothetical protein Q8Q09_00480 [Deltaproteobacteria bacterium]|nr:hypothetical protein [Deltaproteobacteria bacterium]
MARALLSELLAQSGTLGEQFALRPSHTVALRSAYPWIFYLNDAA